MQRGLRRWPTFCGAAARHRFFTAAASSATTPQAYKDRGVMCKDREAMEFLAGRAKELGLPLSLCERQLIAAEADKVGDGDGRMSACDWRSLVRKRSLLDQEKLTLAEYLAKSHDHATGQHLLQYTARLGISFFAFSAAHTAGEAGLHVVGATLVGCCTALGGGTINNVMVGATPVGWMRDPSLLAAAIAAALAGFYLWPLSEMCMQSLGSDTPACPSHPMAHGEGKSTVSFAIESVALGSLAVVGAQQGVLRGLHPLVSSCLGVTVCLGGVLRDIMCHRDISIGAHSGCQSYALASFSGAAVYVALREAHVRNCAGSMPVLLHGGIPIGTRILAGAGTAVAARAIAWHHQPDGLFATMEANAAANFARLASALEALGVALPMAPSNPPARSESPNRSREA